MPAWCRPCAKCLRSRRSWGCRGFLPRVFGRRCLWRRWCSGRRRARPPARLGGLTSFGAVPRSPPVPSGPSGALHTGGACVADVWLNASARSPARPRRRPPAPRPCPPDPPAPFTPVGYSWLMLLGASPRTPARSRSPSGRRDQTPSIPPASHPVVTSHIPEPTPNFACNSPTTLSNPEIGSLELQRFQTSLKLHSLELHASFLGSGRIDACWWRSRRA